MLVRWTMLDHRDGEGCILGEVLGYNMSWLLNVPQTLE